VLLVQPIVAPNGNGSSNGHGSCHGNIPGTDHDNSSGNSNGHIPEVPFSDAASKESVDLISHQVLHLYVHHSFQL
jgi:hypothetical protein